jgi:WD40 repeat protein
MESALAWLAKRWSFMEDVHIPIPLRLRRWFGLRFTLKSASYYGADGMVCTGRSVYLVSSVIQFNEIKQGQIMRHRNLETRVTWHMIAASADGQRVITGGYSVKTILDGDKARPRINLSILDVRHFRPLITYKGNNNIEAVAITPDGHYAFAATSEAEILMWPVARGAQPTILGQHLAEVHSLFNRGTGKRNPVTVRCLLPLPDNQRLVCGSDSGLVSVWDIENQQELILIELGCRSVRALKLLTDGAHIIAFSDYGIHYVNLNTGEIVRQIEHENWYRMFISNGVQEPDDRPAYQAISMTVTDCGQWGVYTEGQILQLYDLMQMEVLCQYVTETPIRKCAIVSNGSRIILITADNRTHILATTLPE